MIKFTTVLCRLYRRNRSIQQYKCRALLQKMIVQDLPRFYGLEFTRKSLRRIPNANVIQLAQDRSLSVLWVTNLAAPYRRPVWRELSARNRLTVGLLESNRGLAEDPTLNRGKDWHHTSTNEIHFEELSTWKYSRGESRFYALKGVRDAMAVRNYDVVLFGGWESPAYWSLLAASVLMRTARVGFYESPANTMTHTSGPIAALRRIFFRAMTRVVVPGVAAQHAILEMGVPANRILQGFNAVDVTAFHEATLLCARDGSDPPEAGHRFLYVGQLISRKRVQEIVTAFMQVAQESDELTIVGTGELLPELKCQAETNKARVSFLGHVANSELPEIMAAHHTLVLASKREVWGLVINEALAAGMHVVVSDNCGVSRSIAHMRGVFMVKESLHDLEKQMRLSRAAWAGRVASPEILQYTPSRFAAVFETAFVAAHQAVTKTNLGGR